MEGRLVKTSLPSLSCLSHKIPLRLNHKDFKFIRYFTFGFLWLAFSADLFALPIKTSILNPEKQVVGQALVYIDYVELLKLDGTPLGRLGVGNRKNRLKCFAKSVRAKLPTALDSV